MSKFEAKKRATDSSHAQKPNNMIPFDIFRTNSEIVAEFLECNTLDYISEAHGVDRVLNQQPGGTGAVQMEGGAKQFFIYGMYWENSAEATEMAKKTGNKKHIDFTRQGKRPENNTYSLNTALVSMLLDVPQLAKGLPHHNSSNVENFICKFLS